MNLLRESWSEVKPESFHLLTKEELIDQVSISALDSRLAPLFKWLLVIGKTFESLNPERCAILKDKVRQIASKTKDPLLVPFERQEEVFLFGVFFGAYGCLFLEDEELLGSADLLCAKLNDLEMQIEREASDDALASTLCSISSYYEKFIDEMTLSDS